MKPTDIKFYPLPNGEFVVSYWDSLRKMRIQKTFADETSATEKFNELRTRKPLKESKRSMKDFSIEELIHIYLDEVPEASLAKAPQLVKDFLDQFSIYRSDQITELSMRCFYQRQKLEYDYTSHSLATRKYQIQGFFKWMVSRGIIDTSPQSKISMGRSKVYKRKLLWVKPKAIQQLLDGAKLRSPGFLYPILLLVSETAAATSDIIQLKWPDVDLKTGRVSFHEIDRVQNRNLEISETLVKSLKTLDQISQHVFTNLEGRPFRKEILVRELRILKRQLGIQEDWVFRDLRHSYAVNFLKSGGQMTTLQKTLGHSHPRMTEELYGRFKTSSADFFDLQVVPGTGTLSSENYKF